MSQVQLHVYVHLATALFASQYFKVIYSINPAAYFIKLPFSSTKNVMLIS